MSLTYGFGLGDEERQYTAEEFSSAMRALTGDGVTGYGRRFSAVPNGFVLTVGTGYGFAAGHWVKNNEPLRLTVSPPHVNRDRIDALVLRVREADRQADIAILEDVDAAALRRTPSVLRAGGVFCIVLYLVRVRRGASYLAASDLTDLRDDAALCGSVPALSSVTARMGRVCAYIGGGLDAALARLEADVRALTARTDAAANTIDQRIRTVGVVNTAGTLVTARRAPEPAEEWLLCDGRDLPAGYPALGVMLDGRLPALCMASDRYRTYIYGGRPGAAAVNRRG